MKKIFIIGLLMIVLLSFTACWDRIEIDRKAFVSTVALDIGDEINKYKVFMDPGQSNTNVEDKLNVLNVTFGYPDISSLSQDFGSRIEEKKISTMAMTVQEAISDVTGRSSRNINLDHSKMLIISNEMFKYPKVLKQAMEYFRKNTNVNRQTQVIVVNGKAADFEKFKPEMENNFQTYMTGILENSDRNIGVMPLNLSDFLSLSSNKSDIMIPYIDFINNNKEIILDGVALIKDYKIVGRLNNKETSNIELLRGNSKTGKKTIIVHGMPVDYVIENTRKKMSLVSLKGDKLIININLMLEGALTEIFVDKDELQSDVIKNYQNKLNDVLNSDSEELVEKFNKNYSVDLLEIRKYMQKFHPKKYASISGEFQQILKNAKINISFKTKIRRIGVLG